MLTGRQQEIWDFLVEYVDAHGYPPTVREIGEAVGLASPSTVHAHLANLERAGLLKRDPTKPRALELVGRERGESIPVVAAEMPRLPLLGQIAAGILDGDLLVVQRTQDARNGDIVVALAGDDESADEATVKRFFREDGRVRLQPENASMEPIYARHVQILGRVAGVFREL